MGAHLETCQTACLEYVEGDQLPELPAQMQNQPEDFNKPALKVESTESESEAKHMVLPTFHQIITSKQLVYSNQVDNQSQRGFSQSEMPEFGKISKISLAQAVTIRLDDLTVLGENQNEVTNFYVPLSVIRMAIPKQLRKQIEKQKKVFLGEGISESKIANEWKLHPKGYYIYQAREKSAKRTVITNKMYYEGTMQALDRAMVASGAGLLITKDSIYKGYFVKGAAHGKGTLSLINAVVFQGDWKNGLLEKGTINSPAFYFSGELKNGWADGRGVLKLRSKKFNYEGTFVNGLFEGKDCKYDSQQYIYEGDFLHGHKHGMGTLREKQAKKKPGNTRNEKKKKYQPLLTLSGQWQQDNFVENQ